MTRVQHRDRTFFLLLYFFSSVFFFLIYILAQFIYLFTFWPCGIWVFVPQQGIEPAPSALEARSPTQWMTGKVPSSPPLLPSQPLVPKTTFVLLMNLLHIRASLVAQLVKNLLAMWETWV